MLREDIALSFVSYFLMPEQRRVFAIIPTGTSEIFLQTLFHLITLTIGSHAEVR